MSDKRYGVVIERIDDGRHRRYSWHDSFGYEGPTLLAAEHARANGWDAASCVVLSETNGVWTPHWDDRVRRDFVARLTEFDTATADESPVWYANVIKAAIGEDKPAIAVRLVPFGPVRSYRTVEIKDAVGNVVGYVEQRPETPIDKGVVVYVRLLHEPGLS